MTAPTAAGPTHDLVVTHTRALKLPGVARTFEALARQARDAHWPHEDYLHEVLSAEPASCSARRGFSRSRRSTPLTLPRLRA